MSGDGGKNRGRDGELTRRHMIGLGVAAAAGGVLAHGAIRAGRRSATDDGKLVVSANCLGCTGCIVVCPEAALSLEPGCRVAVADDRCTRCGYCVAACPVDALRVTREAGDG